MKIRIAGGLLLAFAIPLSFLGCKDDEPKPAAVGFENAVEEVNESDGTITSFHPLLWQSFSGETGATGKVYNIRMTLDKAASETSIVSVSVGGTATRNSAATPGDYDMTGTAGTQNITIEKGATEVLIPVTIFEDFDFEIDEADSLFETIELTITSVVSGSVKLGEQTSYKLKILEDDTYWILQWATNGTTSAGDVDMDLLFTFGGELIWGSINEGSEYEGSNLPAGFPAGSYGVSYTYYSGTSDDVDFLAAIFTSAGTVNSARYIPGVDDPLIYEGHYTLANINAWDVTTSPPKISQTMTKTGINVSSLTALTAHSTGSRIKTSSFLRSLPKKLTQRTIIAPSVPSGK
jgi:hypothetical protein